MFNLNQALEAINDKPEFTVRDKGTYTVIDYNLHCKDTFIGKTEEESKILLNLRGTAFDNATGKIIRLMYHKFFNVGEYPATDAQMDFTYGHVIMQKLDGSLIAPIITPTGFELGTRAGVTDVSKLADAYLNNSPLRDKYIYFIVNMICNDFTPMFEFCSQENRVVLNYKEPKLVLTGIRHNKTGQYFTYNEMLSISDEYSIPVVNAVQPITNFYYESFIREVSEYKDDEGVVIRFEGGNMTGHMVKIKSTEYVALHHFKDKIATEKKLYAVIFNHEESEILSYFSEYSEKINIIKDDINNIFIEIDNFYLTTKHIVTQKEYAEFINKHPMKSILFDMRKFDITSSAAVEKLTFQSFYKLFGSST